MNNHILKNLWNSALDLIYPPDLYCICCGKIIDSTRTYRLCNECMDGIKWANERLCIKCGKLLSASNPGNICFNCREHPHQFDRGYTCAEYGTHERAMVFALKYHSRADIGVTIGEIMADRMLAEYSISDLRRMYDAVIPVPVHSSKKAIRGYNQAELLARACAEIMGFPFEETLEKFKRTKPQHKINAKERIKNVRGAFRLLDSKSVKGKHVLLIDDIITTGNTLGECAKVLLQGKCRFVSCAVVCTTAVNYSEKKH